MAKINFGGLAQDVRGSQNGLTYSRNKGGAYVRAKVSPVQPRTAAQLAVRQNLSQGAKDYGALLTDDQRSAWAGFAAANTRTNVFGNTVHLSALQWFVGLCQVLVQIGKPRITDPPIDLGVGSNLPIVGVETLDPETVTLQAGPGTVDADTAYYIFATAPQSPGKVPQQSLYRFIGTSTVTTTSVGANVDIFDIYNAKWGPPITGKKSYFLVSNVNETSGATTVGQKFSAIAAS